MGGWAAAWWEGQWATYDEEVYTQAAAWVAPGTAVLDIGAGDLRLARRLAAQARVVYAIERRPELPDRRDLPTNVHVLGGDARALPFPSGIDVAILLMRHCRSFTHYRRKLEAAGCRWLITNARWGMGVERIDLRRSPLPYATLAMGWYACRCGGVGFRPGPPEELGDALLNTVHEVEGCPSCHHGRTCYRLP